jgi:hypothetical protein
MCLVDGLAREDSGLIVYEWIIPRRRWPVTMDFPSVSVSLSSSSSPESALDHGHGVGAADWSVHDGTGRRLEVPHAKSSYVDGHITLTVASSCMDGDAGLDARLSPCTPTEHVVVSRHRNLFTHAPSNLLNQALSIFTVAYSYRINICFRILIPHQYLLSHTPPHQYLLSHTHTSSIFTVAYSYLINIYCRILIPYQYLLSHTHTSSIFTVAYSSFINIYCRILIPYQYLLSHTHTPSIFAFAYSYPINIYCRILVPHQYLLSHTHPSSIFTVAYLYPINIYYRILIPHQYLLSHTCTPSIFTVAYSYPINIYFRIRHHIKTYLRIHHQNLVTHICDRHIRARAWRALVLPLHIAWNHDRFSCIRMTVIGVERPASPYL